jgi:hypothetical protein
MMSEQKTKIFLGQAYKHTGKYGEYFTWPQGPARYWLYPSKDDPNKLNLYVSENEKREASNGKPQPKQDAFGIPDEQIPF